MGSLVDQLLDFIDRSPSPYHAVETALERIGSGFAPLVETDAYELEPGGRYVITRSGSSLVAVVMPEALSPESRILAIGAHTDSPTFRVKPQAAFSKEGYLQFGVEVYGGPLFASWTDRDLGLAGRLWFRGADALSPESVLFHSAGSICRIPQLAIHLNREVNTNGLKLNAQTEMCPIWGIGDAAGEGQLLAALCEPSGRSPEELLSFELMLCDTQPSARSGLAGEFVHAPRLDNLAMCFAALSALSRAVPSPRDLYLIALFDNEEVGSDSERGAGGNFLEVTIERLLHTGGLDLDARHRVVRRSLFVSADMAHSVHPNFADKHEPRHMPVMNRGPVIKVNAQERYATTGFSAAVLRDLCRRAEIPHQWFVNRTDLGCGSTIGPMTAARMGMPTVDVGNAMLSMHSVREMAGAADVEHVDRLFTRLFSAP